MDIQKHLDTLFPDDEMCEIPLPVITNYLAGAMLSVLMWWLDAGRPYAPQEINAMFLQLAMTGVERLLEFA